MEKPEAEQLIRDHESDCPTRRLMDWNTVGKILVLIFANQLISALLKTSLLGHIASTIGV